MYPDQLKGKRQRENTRCFLQQSGKQNCLLLRRAASKEKQDTTGTLWKATEQTCKHTRKHEKPKGFPITNKKLVKTKDDSKSPQGKEPSIQEDEPSSNSERSL